MKQWGWGLLFITLALNSRVQAGSVHQGFTYPAGVTGEYKLEYPDDASPRNSKGLLVYLHGDGAGDFDRNDNWAAMSALAKEHDLILLSVKSPVSGHPCGTANGRCWWVNQQRNGKFLDALLRDIEAKHRLDKSRTLFSGQSGGSTFLAGHFLPKYGKDYGGGALLACNGLLRSLSDEGITNGPDPKSFRVDIVTSDKDFLKPGADGVYQSYRKHGFSNLSYFSEPVKFRRTSRGYLQQAAGNHCQFEHGFASLLKRTASAVFAAKRNAFENSMAGREPLSKISSLAELSTTPTSPYLVSAGLPVISLSEPESSPVQVEAVRPNESHSDSVRASTSIRKREVASARPVVTPRVSTQRPATSRSVRGGGFRLFRALFRIF